MVRVSYPQPLSEHTLRALPTPVSSIPPLGNRGYTWLFLAAAGQLSGSQTRGSGTRQLWMPPHTRCTVHVARGSTGCAQGSVQTHAVQPATADRPHTLSLCKSYTCTCVCTHTQSARHAHTSMHTNTSSVCVFVGCRQVQSPRTEGMKAQRACAPAACGWSPVTSLSCLLVLSGPTRTASWRIWTRLG